VAGEPVGLIVGIHVNVVGAIVGTPVGVVVGEPASSHVQIPQLRWQSCWKLI